MPPKTLQIRNSTAEFLIFIQQARKMGIEIRIQIGTIWLSPKAVPFDHITSMLWTYFEKRGNIHKEV